MNEFRTFPDERPDFTFNELYAALAPSVHADGYVGGRSEEITCELTI